MRSVPDLPGLLEEAHAGSVRALGRLLTVVERGGPPADEIADRVHRVIGSGHVVGITGAPGSGKSTLVGRLVASWMGAGRRPAVLAVDPSSPLTGGAILGDRVRMDDVIGDRGFVRSMATRGHHGGLAMAVPGAVRLLGSVGYDPIVIETVGVGQVEVDITATADTTVVVVAPGWGDAVQANKSGLLELADVFVVNKADRPGATDTRRDLELMLDLSHVSGHDGGRGRRAEIVMTTATTGAGAAEIRDAIDAHSRHLDESGERPLRRLRRHQAEIRARVMHQVEATVDAALADLVTEPALTPSAASRVALEATIDRLRPRS